MWMRQQKFGESKEYIFVIDLDDPEYFETCSRCGKEGIIVYEIKLGDFSPLADIFLKRRASAIWKEHFGSNNFCRKCVSELKPWVKKLRDIDELFMYVNKLERKIHEIRRRKNYRPTA